jgi:uncharacterized protein
MQDIEKKWEQRLIDYFFELHHHMDDASHDLGHFIRVHQVAQEIAKNESVFVDKLIILAAAYLHDVVNLPKDHPESKKSSYYSSLKAKDILFHMEFPQEKIEPVCHAIHAHSFSGELEPETIEAKIIQDADRMEALGALGILRTFYVSGRMGTHPYDPEDLHGKRRPLNDKLYGLDHFYCKLFKLPGLLQTEGGRQIADERAKFLHFFIDELEKDLTAGQGEALVMTDLCYRAGKERLKLFDSSDPLARSRPLNSKIFMVDHLIEMKSQQAKGGFNEVFLEQLAKEVGG